MRKAALLMSLVVVSAVAGGSFAYGWYKVTKLPTHDVQTDASIASVSPVQDEVSSSSALTQRNQSLDSDTLSRELSINQQLSALVRENGQISLTLDELQLNQVINDAILSQPQAAQILANTRSLQTTLKGELIETGTVVNLSELPREELPADIQSGLDQLTSVAPMLTNRDIYIGIVARPQVQDGEIHLDQDLSFKLGQFTLPLADVAEQMGFSASAIEQRLNALLNQQGIALENIEILNEKLVITGTKLE